MLKRERIHPRRYLTIVQARSDVFDYIERFYNPRMQRRQEVQDQAFNALTQLSAKTGWNPRAPQLLRPAVLHYKFAAATLRNPDSRPIGSPAIAFFDAVVTGQLTL